MKERSILISMRLARQPHGLGLKQHLRKQQSLTTNHTNVMTTPKWAGIE